MQKIGSNGIRKIRCGEPRREKPKEEGEEEEDGIVEGTISRGRQARQRLDDVGERTGLSSSGLWKEPEDRAV